VIAARRQYRDVLSKRLRAGDVIGLSRLAVRWARTAFAPFAAGRATPGPSLATAMITYRCNLRCRVCDLPDRAIARRRAGDRELTTAEWKRVFDDFRAIGALGVGVTGGEPMLRDDVFELLAHATRRGLHAHLNTDGFRMDDAAARETLRAGTASVNVSLDGATAEEHDAARGRRGAFADAVGALAALRRARGRRDGPKLTAVTVLTHRNVDRVDDVVQVALEAGADRVGVIPVHDFGQGEPASDAARVAKGVEALRRLRARGVLDNSLAYLDLLPRALRGEPSPLRCYAPWTSVVVDCYGDVFPCFPLMERKQPVGRIPLARLWRSPEYAAARRDLASCRACLWNCHAEMNLVLPQWGAGTQVPEGHGPEAPSRVPARSPTPVGA
jgi:MoaA/NifB/PqqE/SkfB family radical SAM enzyme